MTFNAALRLAETKRGSKVDLALDCEDRWVFYFSVDKGKFGALPMFVLKETGEWDYFFMYDYEEMLRAGKPIPIQRSENDE